MILSKVIPLKLSRYRAKFYQGSIYKNIICHEAKIFKQQINTLNPRKGSVAKTKSWFGEKCIALSSLYSPALHIHTYFLHSKIALTDLKFFLKLRHVIPTTTNCSKISPQGQITQSEKPNNITGLKRNH